MLLPHLVLRREGALIEATAWNRDPARDLERLPDPLEQVGVDDLQAIAVLELDVELALELTLLLHARAVGPVLGLRLVGELADRAEALHRPGAEAKHEAVLAEVLAAQEPHFGIEVLANPQVLVLGGVA